MSRVGDNIRKAREKNGFTVKALAKKLGVAEKFLNDVECGRKVASEDFINRAGKFLKADLNDINMLVTDEELEKEKKELRKNKNYEPAYRENTAKKGEVNQTWTDAFSSVLKNVPVFDYTLSNTKGTKELPVHSNKIEGFPQDKVFYIEIQDDEMNGFRMQKGDIAFAHTANNLINNGIFLIEYKGKRAVRQIKTLGNSKILLVSNRISVQTETAEIKEIKVIAKLERVEIKL